MATITTRMAVSERTYNKNLFSITFPELSPSHVCSCEWRAAATCTDRPQGALNHLPFPPSVLKSALLAENVLFFYL